MDTYIPYCVIHERDGSRLIFVKFNNSLQIYICIKNILKYVLYDLTNAIRLILKLTTIEEIISSWYRHTRCIFMI